MGMKKNCDARDVRLERKAGITILFAILTIACIAMLKVTDCHAGDVTGNGFTLGTGTLQPLTTDIAGKNPGVLTAKYGFSLMKDFTPYIGTGLAYQLPQEAGVTDSSKLKTGMAGQAGISFNLGTNSAMVIDYKYLRLNNDPSSSDKGSAPQSSVGVGVNIKF